MRKPKSVLVAGCPRSGSTIISKLLSVSWLQTAYIEEPLNYETGMVGANEPFVYLHEGSRLTSAYGRLVKDIQTGRAMYKRNRFRPATKNPFRMMFYKLFINRYNLQYKIGTHNPLAKAIISKDPTTSLSVEYLHKVHDYSVIITLRHPCAVVASHQRLGWNRSPIDHLLSNKDLINELSLPFKTLDTTSMDSVERLAWYWRAINEMLIKYARRNPAFVVVENEHFAESPSAVMQQLYKFAGLQYTKSVDKRVQNYTNSKNPAAPRADRVHTLKRSSGATEAWKRALSKQQIDKILSITSETYTIAQGLPNNLRNKS